MFFSNPERRFYVSEVVDLAGAGHGAVQRELARLEAAGLLRTSKDGNLKYYQADPASPIFDDMRSLVVKTFGVADALKAALEPISDVIEVAFIFGSMAKHTSSAKSDVDLMVISDKLSLAELLQTLQVTETQIGRRIEPALYTSKEFQNRVTTDNHFIASVLRQPKIVLIGSLHQYD